MGYTIDNEQHFQIDPVTAPVVVEIFTMYDKGATMQQIVNDLNGRGLRSSRGGKITLNIINNLLKNRRYIGEYRYSSVVIPGGIPAIVSEELFERVQMKREKNKRAPSKHKAEDDYLLTTKLYCGKCGAFMVGESGTSKTKKVHHYYKCVSAKKHKSCDKKTVQKQWIEDLVISHTMQMIMNDAVIDQIAYAIIALQSKENTNLPLLKQQLVEVEKAIQNMLNAIQQGILTSSTKQRLDELEERKSQLDVSILQEQMQKPILTKEKIIFWIHRFRGIDTSRQEQRQKLIDCFVNAIYLYDDRLVLTFNYQDGTKSISLAAVESSDLCRFGTHQI